MIRKPLVPAKYFGCAVLLTACAIPDRLSPDIEGKSSTRGSAANTHVAAAGDEENGNGPIDHCSQPICHNSQSLTRRHVLSLIMEIMDKRSLTLIKRLARIPMIALPLVSPQ
jgi:hypothetical protein